MLSPHGMCRTSASLAVTPKAMCDTPARDSRDHPRLRRCQDGFLRQPDVPEELLRVVDKLGTGSDVGPETAIAKAKHALCARFGVVLGERLEQTANEASRSRHFSDLWEKRLAEASDFRNKGLKRPAA